MSSDSTRWTVIRRAAAGSAPDREEFARRYGPVIRAYLGARWRQTPLFPEVDDAAQQVFLECFKKNGVLGRVDPQRETGFRAYLYGAVRNIARAIERRRARSREQQADSKLDLEAFACKEESLAQVFERAWAGAVMRDAAALQLERARAMGPEAVRRHRLLALRFGEGRPIREIASEWEADAALLHREYAKARGEFRLALMDVLSDLHGGGPEAIESECDRLRRVFS